jgi:hypothetical protein
MSAKPWDGPVWTLGTRDIRAEMPIRVVNLFHESLMWYRNSMNAAVSACDLDAGWAVIALGSSPFILLSSSPANDSLPIGTVVCATVDSLVGLRNWAASSGLKNGDVKLGPLGPKALWLTDPEGNALLLHRARLSFPARSI